MKPVDFWEEQCKIIIRAYFPNAQFSKWTCSDKSAIGFDFKTPDFYMRVVTYNGGWAPYFQYHEWYPISDWKKQMKTRNLLYPANLTRAISELNRKFVPLDPMVWRQYWRD